MFFSKTTAQIEQKLSRWFKPIESCCKQSIFFNEKYICQSDPYNVTLYDRKLQKHVYFTKLFSLNEETMFKGKFLQNETYKIEWNSYREKESEFSADGYEILNFVFFQLGKIYDYKQRFIGIVFKNGTDENMWFIEKLLDIKPFKHIYFLDQKNLI